MMYCRTILKEKGIFLTVWSKNRNFDAYKKILVCLYGCPSHPYDHIPHNFNHILENDYIVVFPNYYGTRGSDGICDFNNCTTTVIDLIDIFKNSLLTNSFNNSKIDFQDKDITLMGASFGGYVALSACAKSNNTQRVIACSPIIDWVDHNNDNDEANLEDLANYIGDSFSNLRRCTNEGLHILSSGSLAHSKEMMLNGLKNKDVLIIHGDNDPQVKSLRSHHFINQLSQKGNGTHKFHSVENGGHVLLHHYSINKKVFESINSFLCI